MSRGADARVLLARVARDCHPAALASSLSAEDMVLTDLVARDQLPVEILVLDTGRLHGDTLDLIGKVERHYGLRLSVWRPQPAAVREYVLRHGRDGFYRSAELRRECCHLRKVEPLGRALVGRRAWITGLRREQSALRSDIALEEWDAQHGLKKFNPLADWSEQDVWDYIREYDVPCNALYDHGYRSIGCAPCTRPVVAGEGARDGRWWWEEKAPSECGIHFAPDGKLVREKEKVA
jgi:phosphoadenosine phosphosulfate reductase